MCHGCCQRNRFRGQVVNNVACREQDRIGHQTPCLGLGSCISATLEVTNTDLEIGQQQLAQRPDLLDTPCRTMNYHMK